jgi:hypothetical protein
MIIIVQKNLLRIKLIKIRFTLTLLTVMDLTLFLLTKCGFGEKTVKRKKHNKTRKSKYRH